MRSTAKRDVTIGLTAEAKIPSLIQVSPEPLVPAFFLDSSSPVRMVNPQEIRRLSQLASVIVLISKASAKELEPLRVAKSSTDSTKTGLLGELINTEKLLKTEDPENQSAFGEVAINFPEMVVYRNGEVTDFTNIEFKTLKYLVQNPRRVISRDELLNKVWGYHNYPCTRTVDNTILKLRQKLERNPSRPIHFRTIHGAGYKFVPEAPPTTVSRHKRGKKGV